MKHLKLNLTILLVIATFSFYSCGEDTVGNRIKKPDTLGDYVYYPEGFITIFTHPKKSTIGYQSEIIAFAFREEVYTSVLGVENWIEEYAKTTLNKAFPDYYDNLNDFLADHYVVVQYFYKKQHILTDETETLSGILEF